MKSASSWLNVRIWVPQCFREQNESKIEEENGSKMEDEITEEKVTEKGNGSQIEEENDKDCVEMNITEEGREMEQEKAEANDKDDVEEKGAWGNNPKGYFDWEVEVNTWNMEHKDF